MGSDEITAQLTRSDVALLVEALDSHEYWQLGDVLPRNNGVVFIPGDIEPDVLWQDHAPSENQREAIAEVRRCRALAEMLWGMLDGAEPNRRTTGSS
ncbi:MAG TPA: hypothetical protein VGL75_10225 [Acidothermaceae bacterium]